MKKRTLKDVAEVRSKNAGPFWLTVDVIFDSKQKFEWAKKSLDTKKIADALRVKKGDVRRYDMTDINVTKISLVRPVTQGNLNDRDMHAASFACVVEDIKI